MRRADRLFRIVQVLRAGRLLTARDLARKLEVSERTVYRDVRDLQHHLVRASPLGRSPSRPNLCHHQLGRRAVRQAEL